MRLRSKCGGIIQIPVLIGLLIFSVALPAIMTLVKQNQDVRNRAVALDCGQVKNGTRNCVGSKIFICKDSGIIESSGIDCATTSQTCSNGYCTGGTTAHYTKCLLGTTAQGNCVTTDSVYGSKEQCTFELSTYPKCKANPNDPECKCYEFNQWATCQTNCKQTMSYYCQKIEKTEENRFSVGSTQATVAVCNEWIKTLDAYKKGEIGDVCYDNPDSCSIRPMYFCSPTFGVGCTGTSEKHFSVASCQRRVTSLNGTITCTDSSNCGGTCNTGCLYNNFKINNNEAICEVNGSSSKLIVCPATGNTPIITSCTANQICDSATKSCKTIGCPYGNQNIPNGQAICNDNTLVKCPATGNTYSTTPCSTVSGETCDATTQSCKAAAITNTPTPQATNTPTPPQATNTPTPQITLTPTPVVKGGCDYFDPVRGMIVMNMNPGQVECWDDKLVSCPSTGGNPIVTDCVAGGKVCNPNKRECEYKWCSYNGQLFSPGQVGCDQSGSVIVTCPATGKTPTIKTCNSDQKCKSENGVFSCVDKCIYNGVTYGEGTIKCDGNILVTCPQYGGKPVTKDCAATSQACDQNKQTCVEAIKKCTYGTLIIAAGNKTCSGNLLLDCPVAGGTASMTDCTANGQVCDGVQKVCVAARKCSVCADIRPGYVGPDKRGGDYNCDGMLTPADMGIWRTEFLSKNIPKTRWEASGNCFHDINKYFETTIYDYSLWRTNYTNSLK